jgi:hypothetical protein
MEDFEITDPGAITDSVMNHANTLQFLGTPLINTGDLCELVVRFLFNTLVVWVMIHKLYYPKSQRKDYYFTFAMISVSVFFLIFLLASVKIKVGLALGLFAIFGIIRYRTESMSVREMTYLFVIIALSVINALAVTLSYTELVVTNLIFIGAMYMYENLPWITHLSDKLVLYDRVELIVPERRAELMADLESRLGLKIEKIELGAVDFLRDTVMIKVFYHEHNGNTTTNSVNHRLKLPKVQD